VIQHRASQMVIFHTLVTSGSFTQAAAKLKTSTSYVSKQIGALEAELNLLLVQRTTRTLVLTDAGQQFAHYCEQVFEATQNADAIMLDARDDISGTIRLGSSQSFGTLHIIPALEVLQQKYPELRFELSLFDHKADMLEEGLDLWITNHEQLNEGYIAQHLAETNFVVVASPDYLLKHGVPHHPQALAQHNCVIYQSKSRNYDRWSFAKDDLEQTVHVAGNYRVDLAEAVRNAVIAGRGIGYVATYLLSDEFQSGKLIQLLPDWKPLQQMPVYVVYPRRRHLPTKYKVIIECLKSHIGHPPYWDKKLKPWLGKTVT